MVTFIPVQVHALMLASFASLIAPFGGFFASGMKRAFGLKVCCTWHCYCNVILYFILLLCLCFLIKLMLVSLLQDFGDYFPGHGGVFDRMDCQLLMHGFSLSLSFLFLSLP